MAIVKSKLLKKLSNDFPNFLKKDLEKFTNIIRDFNEHVKDDKNSDQIIIPIGDGLTVCRKI